MRQAASAWERDYSDKFGSSTVFYCKFLGVRCVVHGDDFTFTGKRRDLFEIKRKLEESYELKMRAMLGDDVEDDKEITLLNRTLIWAHGSLTYEADPKHVREILSYFKLDHTSKGLHLPIVKETKEELAE